MEQCQKINLQEPQRNRKLCQFNKGQYCISEIEDIAQAGEMIGLVVWYQRR